MSIKSKLQLGFGFLGFFILSVALIGWIGIKKSHANLEEIVYDSNVKLEFSNALLNSVNKVSRDIRTMVMLDDIALIKETENKILVERLNYDNAWQKLSALPSSEKEKGIYDQINAISITAREINNRILPLAIANKDDEAKTLLLKTASPLIIQWQEAINSNIQLQKERIEQNTKNTESTLKLSMIVLAFSVIALFFFGILMVYAIIRKITVAVNTVQHACQTIANGDLNSKFDTTANDELGVLLRSIHILQAILQKFTNDIQRIVDASELGELSRRLPVDQYVGEWQTIIVGLNTILDEAEGPINAQAITLQQLAGGDFSARITESFKGEHNRVKDAINNVAEIIDHSTREIQRQNWLKTGLSELSERIRGDMSLPDLTYEVVSYLVNYVNAQIGAMYLWNEHEKKLVLTGSYAYEFRKNLSQQFALGESLVGQAALEKRFILLTNLPDDYVRITSSIGQILPRNVLVLPVLHKGILKGVIELGSLDEFSQQSLDLLNLAVESIGMAIIVSESVTRTQFLLEESQELAKRLQQQQEELQQTNEELEQQAKILQESEQRLQMQHEELQQTNEELEEQSQALQLSEQKLKIQQEELQQTNEELEERTEMLEGQRDEIEKKNSLLQETQKDLTRQANALEIASKYKSEFLANMSHELRTPLNSMLLLSRSLTDNRDGNLNDKQIEIATIMHQSGNDLLRIINDILDLSKIESGHEKAIMENVLLSDIATQIQSLYQPVAEDKGLDFIVDMAVDVPKYLRTDSQRLGQILRNLLSNAFKFTLQGSVILRIETTSKSIHFTNKKLCAENTLTFSVHDTGVGISKDSQLVIWEAFQQADGSISRQYGGTGLGLSISRELVRLLGGEIQLESELNVGSTFSFYLPQEGIMTHDENHHTHVSPAAKIENFNQPIHLTNKNNAQHDKPIIAIADDRETINEEDNVILIVEDDPIFAQILANLCQENNNKYLVATTAHEALDLISQYKLIGVFLDMELPEKNGWSVLLHIKETLEISHIPVYVVSANEAYDTTRFHGALDFLGKPVTVEQLENALEIITKIQSNPIKKVLVVEDDTNLALSIKQLLGEDGLEIHIAENGKNALNRIEKIAYDLVVLDLGLPDMTGAQLLEHIRSSQVDLPPVIVYTGRELTRKEYESVQYYTSSVIIKNVRSDERLLEEARLFLHRAVERLPDKAKKMLLSLHDKDALFSGKRVLLVDDDIRNVFSLSAVLEERGISIVAASCATEALEKLEFSKNALPFDLVITDIMMPKMNGLELIRLIRAEEAFYSLPIIALTAKAMREDRINCIEAGASDYLTKPIDVDRMLSMMRVWLYR